MSTGSWLTRKLGNHRETPSHHHHMAALLLLALKATAYHGEDNNWLVRVTGFMDANGCMRVSSITDLGADDANGVTDLTVPNNNLSCVVNGDAGLAPNCALSKGEAGSGDADAIAEAQAAITVPVNALSGCEFDEASAPACHKGHSRLGRQAWGVGCSTHSGLREQGAPQPLRPQW